MVFDCMLSASEMCRCMAGLSVCWMRMSMHHAHWLLAKGTAHTFAMCTPEPCVVQVRALQ